ncbi:uncharacterized protein HKW66_Vig0041400 [Vigna angularis]|uniref:Uncharacterized protein n=3 Tax=Phaseolus angularis TaxID=3914 RepID=A0A8T0LEY9_PHAAN|nr:uncharacterized protein HKW66_Vig0041400 [Vigna angularis]
MAGATSLNLWGILSESKRIIDAHSRHFLALSVIFLLPLSFSIIVSPFLFPLLSPHQSQNTHLQLHSQTLTLTPFSLPLILFLLSLPIFSLCALASITHSVFHGFFGRPVKLPSALLSIPPSLPRLIATTFISHLILLSLSLPLPFLLRRLSFASPLLLTASTLFLLALLLALLYLRVSWSLAPVIVVAESTWGLQPLRRSASLVSGMTPVASSSFLFFASLQALLLWTAFLIRSDGWAWKDWAFITQIVLTSTLLMILMLYRAAADTVLYMYCKAVHGELAVDIAQEFAWQYVCLPFDDGKVPHVVSVVHV